MVFFILITCDTYSDLIGKEISKVLPKGVKHEFQSVYGVYDAVLRIEDDSNNTDDSKDLYREIATRIKTLPKVHTTMVLTVAD